MTARSAPRFSRGWYIEEIFVIPELAKSKCVSIWQRSFIGNPAFFCKVGLDPRLRGDDKKGEQG